jgi:hypothetical protein
VEQSPVQLVSLKDAVAPARVEFRERIRAVSRWSLAQGRPVPAEHLALIIEAKVQWRDRASLDHWTRTGVYQHLRCDVFNWCSLHRVLVPDGVPESLWTYLHFLDEHGLLAEGSDPLRRLLDPLRCYGGLGPDGTRETAVPVTCRCFTT